MLHNLDRDEYPDHKGCPNCSANCTLRAFSEFTESKDTKMRVYLAHRAKTMYESDPDCASFEIPTDLKGFIQMTIRNLLGSDLGKAISQNGFVGILTSQRGCQAARIK